MMGMTIERCARSGPKKLTKTYNKGFPNNSTLINFDSSGDIFKVPLKRFEEENPFYDFPVISNSNRENLGNCRKKIF